MCEHSERWYPASAAVSAARSRGARRAAAEVLARLSNTDDRGHVGDRSADLTASVEDDIFLATLAWIE